MLLSTYSRNPSNKHACIERLIREGVEAPDTPVMALDWGRIDLLSKHLQHDPALFGRTYAESEIYPSEFGIVPGDGLHLAPLHGSTLLHMAVEFDERDLLQWMLENGADPNVCSEVDEEGYGGHIPLFHTSVSYTWRDASKAKTLLEAGANPNHRATLRKQLRYIGQQHLERMYEFHDVTCTGFARQFQVQRWVSSASIKVVEGYGGI
jgi:hypothetical protein